MKDIMYYKGKFTVDDCIAINGYHVYGYFIGEQKDADNKRAFDLYNCHFCKTTFGVTDTDKKIPINIPSDQGELVRIIKE